MVRGDRKARRVARRRPAAAAELGEVGEGSPQHAAGLGRPVRRDERGDRGYDIIECETEEQAIEIAGLHPVAAFGTVEVRPFWDWGNSEPLTAAGIRLAGGSGGGCARARSDAARLPRRRATRAYADEREDRAGGRGRPDACVRPAERDAGRRASRCDPSCRFPERDTAGAVVLMEGSKRVRPTWPLSVPPPGSVLANAGTDRERERCRDREECKRCLHHCLPFSGCPFAADAHTVRHSGT